jgi:hypothetical protein
MAVVIDERRLLTAAHVVVESSGRARKGLWVDFPMCEDVTAARRPIAAVRVAERYAVHPAAADVAVVELAEAVPAGVAAAPLRLVKPADVEDGPWWAFGFARGGIFGNPASGVVAGQAGRGWVRLTASSKPGLAVGFSGTGLWSAQYDAVAAVIGQANDEGDGLAITLHTAHTHLPEEKLDLLARWTVDDADEIARAAWGWTLAADREADRHWRPRARGVNVSAERGFRFRGRTTALTEIINWLDRPVPDRRVLVVTGSPGVGKSAVLGRVVTTADAQMAAALPADDAAPRATVGSVACAVHAKGKTALEVATEIARAASAPIPDQVEDLVPGLRAVLDEQDGRRFNLVIDALDEASDPGQARTIATGLLVPIAATCADAGAQVLVGTRRVDDAGELLQVFGPAATTIDLDTPRYFHLADLTAYTVATLQLRGSGPTNPYQDHQVAEQVARRIAELAEPNFLIAGLVAPSPRPLRHPARRPRRHLLHRQRHGHPQRLSGPGGAGGGVARPRRADRAGLRRGARVPRRAVGTGDTGAGLAAGHRRPPAPVRGRLGGQLPRRVHRRPHPHLSAVPPSPHRRTYRRPRPDRRPHPGRGRPHPRLLRLRAAGRVAACAGVRAAGRVAACAGVPAALPVRSRHPRRAGRRSAGRPRLPAARRPAPAHPRHRPRAHPHWSTDRAAAAPHSPGDSGQPRRATGLLTVTEALDNTGTTIRDFQPTDALPYRGLWAAARPRVERTVLEGHSGSVRGVSPVRVGGRELLASAGGDGTVRLWDPATGAPKHVLRGHTDEVTGVCAVGVGGRELVASASDDGTGGCGTRPPARPNMSCTATRL